LIFPTAVVGMTPTYVFKYVRENDNPSFEQVLYCLKKMIKFFMELNALVEDSSDTRCEK